MRGSEPGAGLEQIQTEMAEWGRRSWPDANTTSEGLALAEEVGELARCIVKRQHGTRGTGEEWTAELRKEVGDVALVLAFIADLEGWSLAECIADRWATIRQRDWVANPLGHGIPTDAPPAAAAPEPEEWEIVRMHVESIAKRTFGEHVDYDDDPAPTPAAAPLDEPPLNVADATGQCNHCEAPVWNDATTCWNCGGPSVAQFAPPPAPAPVEDAQEPPRPGDFRSDPPEPPVEEPR